MSSAVGLIHTRERSLARAHSRQFVLGQRGFGLNVHGGGNMRRQDLWNVFQPRHECRQAGQRFQASRNAGRGLKQCRHGVRVEEVRRQIRSRQYVCQEQHCRAGCERCEGNGRQPLTTLGQAPAQRWLPGKNAVPGMLGERVQSLVRQTVRIIHQEYFRAQRAKICARPVQHDVAACLPQTARQDMQKEGFAGSFLPE
jgi:hypothetical protein